MNRNYLIPLLVFGAFVAKAIAKGGTTAASNFDFRTDDLSEARSTRNNNPGNVKKPGTADWKGTIDYDSIGHAIFSDYIFGTRAMITDVRSKINRGLDTLNKIIPVYCPSSDGCDTKAYINFLVKNSGIAATESIDSSDKEKLYKVVQAMAWYEAGYYPNTNKNRTKLNRAIFNMAWQIL